MDRSVALANKADEIKRELEKWAAETGILADGEGLVFSLRIQAGFGVEQDTIDTRDVQTLRVLEFFTPERLRGRAEFTSFVASRAYKCLKDNYSGCYNVTLREFCEEVSREEILRMPSFGELSMQLIEYVLREDAQMRIKP